MNRIVLPILVAAVCTFGMRALPFLLFRRGQQMPQRLSRLGKQLPSAIMAVLIVYCMRDVPAGGVTVLLPKLIGCGVVAATYRWKHNTLLSIAAATGSYMLALQFI